MTTSSPAALTPVWTVARVDAGNHLTGVSCSSAVLCVAVDINWMS